jgi:hypothetical protein
VPPPGSPKSLATRPLKYVPPGLNAVTRQRLGHALTRWLDPPEPMGGSRGRGQSAPLLGKEVLPALHEPVQAALAIAEIRILRGHVPDEALHLRWVVEIGVCDLNGSERILQLIAMVKSHPERKKESPFLDSAVCRLARGHLANEVKNVARMRVVCDSKL